MASRWLLPSVSALILGVTVLTLPRDAEAIAFPEWRAYGSVPAVWSEATNWDTGAAPATGDYVRFADKTFGGRVRNDLTGLSIARLTFASSREYILEGNALNISESIVVEKDSGPHSIEFDISGVAQILVAENSELKLSGTNTFTGQIDLAGELEAQSNSALGSTAGITRVFETGQLRFAGRDFGEEPIQVSGAVGLTNCGILNMDGSSVLRNIKTNGGTVCIQNFGTLNYPNGIQQAIPGFDVYFLRGLHIVGGTSNADGTLTVLGESDVIWNSTAQVAITFRDEGEELVSGDLRGSGTAAAVDFRGGTFSPGTGNAAGRFTIGGLLKLQDGEFSVTMNSTQTATGYSQATADSVDLGPNTALQLVQNFQPTVGQEFRIIDNTGNQPVVGTFEGLAEGATFSRAGRTYTITYKGGTGNDVVITRTTDAPTDPLPFKRTVPMLARS